MMQDASTLAHLANHVRAIELDSHQVSEPWYDFAPADPQDIQVLLRLTRESLELLYRLDTELTTALTQTPAGAERERLQYAYHLAKELIQSRTSVEAMLSGIVAHDMTGFREYYRALALKEQAAAEQAERLSQTVSQLH